MHLNREGKCKEMSFAIGDSKTDIAFKSIIVEANALKMSFTLLYLPEEWTPTSSISVNINSDLKQLLNNHDFTSPPVDRC